MRSITRVSLPVAMLLGVLLIGLTLVLPLPSVGSGAQNIYCDIYTNDTTTVRMCMQRYSWGSVRSMTSSDLRFYINRANATT